MAVTPQLETQTIPPGPGPSPWHPRLGHPPRPHGLHYLAQVFSRCTDLEGLLLEARQPRQLYKAKVSYEQRHLAKTAGFHWNSLVPGAWARRLSDAQRERLSFPVELVDTSNG